MILLLICALVFHSAFTQSKQGKVMTNRASGTFEVKMSPQDQGADMPVGRMDDRQAVSGRSCWYEQRADVDGEQRQC